MEKEEKKVNGTPIEDEKLEEVAGGGRVTCFNGQQKTPGEEGIRTTTNMRVQSTKGLP